MPNTLFLRLESPLQSWGERAQWGEPRDTAPEPTKSGVVGLLACALGWKDDAAIAALTDRIRIGVRCDQPGAPTPLVDYHTIGGGYSKPQLLTAEGKEKRSSGKPHTEITKRHYLCDASFLVAVQSDEKTILTLADAIQSPVWPIFLGRKSCVPSRPPFDGVKAYNDLETALQKHPAKLYPRHYQRPLTIKVRLVLECESHEINSVRRRDVLVSRSLHLYKPRYSREKWIDNVPVEYLESEGT